MTRKKTDSMSLKNRVSYGVILSATGSSSQKPVALPASVDLINLSQLSIKVGQEFFDRVDQDGMTSLHRLMMQPDDGHLSAFLHRYYRLTSGCTIREYCGY